MPKQSLMKENEMVRTNNSIHRQGIICLCAVFAVATLSGCAAKGDTTCREYGEMSTSQRSSVEKAVLREHDLDDSHFDNTTGINSALTKFCGTLGSGGATKNHDVAIDKGVNWNSRYW